MSTEQQPVDSWGVCPCRSDDLDIAHAAAKKIPATETLRDDSHFMVSIRRCRCGRSWLRLFMELVDFANGDDSQAVTLAPLTSAEAESLAWLKRPVSEVDLTRIVSPRRQIVRSYPRGGVAGVSWVDGPLVILPHD